MNTDDIKITLKKLTADIDAIVDPQVTVILRILLNLVDVLIAADDSNKETIQKLKDEINRLKGEQGKPDFNKKKKGKDPENTNHSSEADRNKRNKKKSRKKRIEKTKEIEVDRCEIVTIDMSALPADAVFKGYETTVIQDLVIVTNNVAFKRPIYYSPSLKKSFVAKLPDGYQGEFGPGIRSLVINLYRDAGMTEPAIARFFKTWGVSISGSTISRMITEGHDHFHQEKEAIINAGLKATDYQHIDDTGSKVAGKSHYTHIICNPYFTAFFTRPRKDRLTLLEILCRGELKFSLNQTTYELMTALGLSEKCLNELKALIPTDVVLTRNGLDEILKKLFPNLTKQKSNRRIILEACAIVYYRSTEYAIKHLVCDDAPQFNLIAMHKSLCWVHEGRHFKKLNPFVPAHRAILDDFLEKFWDYYQLLLEYKEAHTPEKALQLSQAFDALFLTKTGYDELDKRIAKTLAKKGALLLVLDFPFLPLHNNPAELGARVQARMRDVNLQTISENGMKSKDTFATIFQTAKKLGVNTYRYVYDRITKKFEMTSLADLITAKLIHPELITT